MNNYHETPIIIESHFSDEEIELEVRQYFNRQHALKDFLDRKIAVDTFEDILNENGIDVIDAYGDWSEGISYADF